MRKAPCRLYALSTLVFAACAAPVGEIETAESQPNSAAQPAVQKERLAAIDYDIQLGEEGEDIAHVHAYLARYGYLPSETLRARYPTWSPIIGTSPADAEVFDETSELAIKAFQRDVGLSQSGIVDAETREFFGMERCPVPEGLAEGQNDDVQLKFHVDGGGGFYLSRKWHLFNDGPGVTYDQARAARNRAFARWGKVGGVSFYEVEPWEVDSWGATISFADTDDVAAYHSNGRLFFDNGRTWSVASTLPSGRLDLETFALHEIGHALGLAHSDKVRSAATMAGAIMFPFVGGVQRELGVDDRIAISRLWPRWKVVDARSASDIAVTSGDVKWIVGTDDVEGGHSVYSLRWDGEWVRSSRGAVRIAAGRESPWIVDEQGRIFAHLAFNGSWQQYAGCAKDIGVGANGAVWVIGCTVVDGGFSIHKWTGSGWKRAPGAGVRIAVDPDGAPWVVNDEDKIYRFGRIDADGDWRGSSDPENGKWEELPGRAKDIAIDPWGYAYHVGTKDYEGQGNQIFVWNEQRALNAGIPPPKARREWLGLRRGARNLAAGASGVWAVNGKEVVQQLR
jgi:hypothetical protein